MQLTDCLFDRQVQDWRYRHACAICMLTTPAAWAADTVKAMTADSFYISTGVLGNAVRFRWKQWLQAAFISTGVLGKAVRFQWKQWLQAAFISTGVLGSAVRFQWKQWLQAAYIYFFYRNVRQGCKVPVKTITTRSFFVSMEGLGTAVRFQWKQWLQAAFTFL